MISPIPKILSGRPHDGVKPDDVSALPGREELLKSHQQFLVELDRLQDKEVDGQTMLEKDLQHQIDEFHQIAAQYASRTHGFAALTHRNPLADGTEIEGAEFRDRLRVVELARETARWVAKDADWLLNGVAPIEK